MTDDQPTAGEGRSRISMLERAAAYAQGSGQGSAKGTEALSTGKTVPRQARAVPATVAGSGWGRRLGGPLIMLGLSLLVGLALAEGLLRLLGLRFDISPFQSDPVLHHVHPRDYRFIVAHPDGAVPDFPVRYDGDGRPAPTEPAAIARAEAKRGAPCRVALLGDSFTEAIQVPYAQTFAGRLAEASPCEVRNWGTGSYSPTMYGLQWRDQVAAWKPDLVLVQLYSNDIWDDEVYARQARTDAGGNILAVPGPPDGRAATLLRHSYVARLAKKVGQIIEWRRHNAARPAEVVDGLVEENPELGERSPRLMAELVGAVVGSGARLGLMVVPSKARALARVGVSGSGAAAAGPEFSERWQSWFVATAFPETARFVDLVTPFAGLAGTGRSPFLVRDFHFNADGHAVVARTACSNFPRLLSRSGTCAELAP